MRYPDATIFVGMFEHDALVEGVAYDDEGGIEYIMKGGHWIDPYGPCDPEVEVAKSDLTQRFPFSDRVQ